MGQKLEITPSETLRVSIRDIACWFARSSTFVQNRRWLTGGSNDHDRDGPGLGRGVVRSRYSKPAEPCVVTGVERDVIVRGAKSGWDLVVRELDHLQLLRDNWDGDGSKAPSLATVGRAVRTAELLAAHGYPAPTTATTTRAGGILITWEDDPAYREIEIVRVLNGSSG